MEKKAYSVRLDPELLDKVKEYADQEGETVTAVFEQALKSFLSAPNSEADISTASDVVADLRERIERLEANVQQLKESDKHKDISFLKKRLKDLESKFNALYSSGVVVEDKPTYSATKKNDRPGEPIDPDELGDLITKKEASALTGYSVNTLNRTFSQNDIFEVSKRGKAGLYSKSEVLERIGTK